MDVTNPQKKMIKIVVLIEPLPDHLLCTGIVEASRTQLQHWETLLGAAGLFVKCPKYQKLKGTKRHLMEWTSIHETSPRHEQTDQYTIHEH